MQSERLSGKELTKSPNSQAVVNIVPQRGVWSQIQNIRTLIVPDARCGPHFSFLDPFVLAQHFEEAAQLLTEALRSVQPFKVRLGSFNFFDHKKSCTLYLEPEFEPEDGLQNLLDACLKVFPQCNDLVLRSDSGRYIPHMSLGRFKNKRELNIALTKIKRNWQPIEFVVKEIYLLARQGGDPFEAMHTVHLGDDASPPHFGEGSPGSSGTPEENDAIGRTVVVCGIPKSLSNDGLLDAFKDDGFEVAKAEMLLNPNRSTRPCGVVEFPTKEGAVEACLKNSLSAYPTMYIRPLHKMMFPDVIGGCCSLDAVSRILKL